MNMIVKLTNEMRSALREHPGRVITVEDDQTQSRYVLLPLDVYQRAEALFADDSFDARDAYAAQSAVAGEAGWDDEEMDIYDDYDAHRPQS